MGSALTISLPGTPVTQVSISSQVVRFTKEFPVYGMLSSASTVSLHVPQEASSATYAEVQAEAGTYNNLEKYKTYGFLTSQTRTLPLSSSRPLGFTADDVFEFNAWYEVA
jgi:hypothetical protein